MSAGDPKVDGSLWSGGAALELWAKPSNAVYELPGGSMVMASSSTTDFNKYKVKPPLWGFESNPSKGDAVLVIDSGVRYRLPRSGISAYDTAWASGWPRDRRETATAVVLYNIHGTIYEYPLPYRQPNGVCVDDGGFRRIRPIATHGKMISDFALWRGLFVVSGVKTGGCGADPRCVPSIDGNAALWVGSLEDVWKLPPPSGRGSVWKSRALSAGEQSDQLLMHGYFSKTLEISSSSAATFEIWVDFAGDDTWHPYGSINVAAGATVSHSFPAGYGARWVKLKALHPTTASAAFAYAAK